MFTLNPVLYKGVNPSYTRMGYKRYSKYPVINTALQFVNFKYVAFLFMPFIGDYHVQSIRIYSGLEF